MAWDRNQMAERAARELRDGIDGATMHVIARAAHLSPLERPEVVDGYVLPFLAMAG